MPSRRKSSSSTRKEKHMFITVAPCICFGCRLCGALLFGKHVANLIRMAPKIFLEYNIDVVVLIIIIIPSSPSSVPATHILFHVDDVVECTGDTFTHTYRRIKLTLSVGSCVIASTWSRFDYFIYIFQTRPSRLTQYALVCNFASRVARQRARLMSFIVRNFLFQTNIIMLWELWVRARVPNEI